MPKNNIERVSTGLTGLDKLIEGGVVKGSATMILGDAGTGKTIFCTQFIMEGLKNGENCMFITFEETPQDIMDDAAVFGWDLTDYIKKRKLILEYRDPFQTTDITTLMQEEIVAYKVTRVAIDSTSVLGLYFKDEHEVRKQLYKLIQALKSTGVTAILTGEMPEDVKASRFGVEEYVADGVIRLFYIGAGDGAYRQLEVKKMRRTNQKKGAFPMEITDKGIVVKPSAL
ncbi:MAG: hypothetical protein HYS81_03000 [Candidatus Aenigmatarchaeota archaeon]|nr:MAG: hypothetical protein HYS81_03000 [Candidatus Aenigmarchaeota archaeon]